MAHSPLSGKFTEILTELESQYRIDLATCEARHNRETESLKKRIAELQDKLLVASQECQGPMLLGQSPCGIKVQRSMHDSQQEEPVEVGSGSSQIDQQRSTEIAPAENRDTVIHMCERFSELSMKTRRRLASYIATESNDDWHFPIIHGLNLPTWFSDVLTWCSKHAEEPERSGVLASIESSSLFKMFGIGVVLTQFILITRTTNTDMQRAVHGQTTPEESEQVLDVCFTSYFIIELFIRFAVHRFYFFINLDRHWNAMDTFLVIFEVLSIGGVISHSSLPFLRAIRILKLGRLLRLVRILGAFRTLSAAIETLIQTGSALIWGLAIIVFVLNLFALIFMGLVVSTLDAIPDLRDQPKIAKRFSDVWSTMIVLLQAVTGGEDWIELYNDLAFAGDFAQYLMLFYILFFTISVSNIVTSLFVEKALSCMVPDALERMAENNWKSMQETDVLIAFCRTEFEISSTGKISQSAFLAGAQKPKVQNFFAANGHSLKEAAAFFEMLQVDDRKSSGDDVKTDVVEVDLKDLVQACLRLKGAASSLDLHALHWDIEKMHRYTLEVLKTIHMKMAALGRAFNQEACSLDKIHTTMGPPERDYNQDALSLEMPSFAMSL